MAPSCFWCLEPAAAPCPSCPLAACPQHLPLHSTVEAGQSLCLPVRVEASAEQGRRLLATRAIRRGEVVLVDRPAAMGPLHASAPLCLECSAPLPCPTFGCPYCGFPLCGEACVHGPVHELECGLLTAKGQKVKITKGDRPAVEYQAIMLLRLLCGPADQLARTDLLSDHVDKLSQQEREVYRAGVVRVVQGLLPAGGWTDDQLFRYVSVIRTNACAAQAGPGKAAQRILHPALATMNHSCLVNTRVFQRADHSVCVRALRDIEEGEEVSNRYTTVFQGRLQREVVLSDAWHFSCSCPRCSDPSDRGAHTDTLLCVRPDCGGHLLPGLEGWRCGGCGAERGRAEVAELEARVGEAVASREGSLGALEELLAEQGTLLHPDHHLLVGLKVQVVQEYGKLMAAQARAGQSWSLKQVRRKVEVCRQVLAALGRIEPGLGATRGLLLQELAAPQLVLLRHGLASGKMDRGKVAEGTVELLAMVEELLEHLQLYEEGVEEEAVRTARQLLQDGREFQEQALGQATG